jgi:hypothetical protein
VTGESKGFAYVNYSTPQSAMMVRFIAFFFTVFRG